MEMSMDRVVVTEASQVAEARRRGIARAQAMGFDETAAGRVAIVVTELATNIVKYGVPGQILVGTYEDATGTGVEVLALDRGEGLPDTTTALRDGHSTGGSAGEGLGAVRRLSDAFDIVSRPGSGTAVLARLSEGRTSAPTSGALPVHGAVSVPLKGEIANGDAYAVRERDDGWTVIVADGLGHGPEAAKASEEAVRVFRRHQDREPSFILSAVHAGLRHTRGGAVSVARYDREAEVVSFAGIGNVLGAVVSGAATKRTVSLAGTAGHAARRIQEFEYPMRPDGLFLLCSDGLATGFSIDGYPGLAAAHPSLVAGVLFRDFARARDDATALVVRGGAP
ncbi:TorS-related protein [Methylorubrum extorquens]|nr:TorS-related protein [Methylorubrum extorquens]